MARIGEMVELLRGLREQVTDRNPRRATDPDAAELLALGKEYIDRLNTIEEKIHNPHAEVDYDILGGRHGGAMLYSRLSWLFMTSGAHDGPPTQGMLEVAAEIERELTQQESVLGELISGDVARLNGMASELGVGYVVTPEPVSR